MPDALRLTARTPSGTQLKTGVLADDPGFRFEAGVKVVMFPRPSDEEQFRLDLQIDPEDPLSFDDKVTLESASGYRKMLGVVAEGKMHSHAKGMTTLIFEGVRLGEKYTCTIDPGAQGKPYQLFKDLELTQEHMTNA